MSYKPTAEAREKILELFKKNPHHTLSMQEIKTYLNEIAPEKYSHGVVTSAIGNLVKHGQSNGIEKIGYNAYRFIGSKKNLIALDSDEDTITPTVINLLQKTHQEILTTVQNIDVLALKKEDFSQLEKLKEVISLLNKAQNLLKDQSSNT